MAHSHIPDVPYVPQFVYDSTPVQLATAAQLAGMPAPDVDSSFRFADFGCGRGRTVLVLAAAYPDSDFIGVDLSYRHISEARSLASAAGLKNVAFIQGSFKSAEARRIRDLDFAVAHGVYSWVSDSARQDLLALIDSSLRPSGLVFLSYYTECGYAQVLPMRSVLKRLSDDPNNSSPLTRIEAIKAMSNLSKANANFFTQNPRAKSVVERWESDDHGYLLHEYFGEDWHLTSFLDVARVMNEAGFRFCGDSILDVRELSALEKSVIQIASDPLIKEDLATFILATPFRKDVFARSQNRSSRSPPEFHDGDHFGVVWPAQTATISALLSREDPLAKILRLLAREPLPWYKIRTDPALSSLSATQRGALIRRGIATLAITRYSDKAHSQIPSRIEKVRFAHKLSRILVENADQRSPPLFFPSRRLGGAVPLPPMIIQGIAAASEVKPNQTWVDRTMERLGASSRNLTAKSPKELRCISERVVDSIRNTWGPFLVGANIVEPI